MAELSPPAAKGGDIVRDYGEQMAPQVMAMVDQAEAAVKILRQHAEALIEKHRQQASGFADEFSAFLDYCHQATATIQSLQDNMFDRQPRLTNGLSDEAEQRVLNGVLKQIDQKR